MTIVDLGCRLELRVIDWSVDWIGAVAADALTKSSIGNLNHQSAISIGKRQSIKSAIANRESAMG
jgi:hypothetical protein